MSGPEHTQGVTPPDAPLTHPLAACLADRDVCCPYCAYDLRGISAGSDGLRCPECGHTTTLKQIHASTGWRRRSATRLAALAASLLLFLGSCVLMVKSEEGSGDGQAAFVYLFIAMLGLPVFVLLSICTGNELWVLFRSRGAPKRSARVLSWLLAIAVASLATLLSLLCLMYT
ncbi:MAG: hypothetical protein KF902_01515 [Phycisphaeraceae bacterium]|nr:hypothetical protein [Phycisphaeraceae bacterium]